MHREQWQNASHRVFKVWDLAMEHRRKFQKHSQESYYFLLNVIWNSKRTMFYSTSFKTTELAINSHNETSSKSLYFYWGIP